MDVLPGIFGRRIIGPPIVFGPMIQVSDLAPAFPENRMPPFGPLLQVDIPSSALELVDSGRAVDVLAAMADMSATTTAIRERAGEANWICVTPEAPCIGVIGRAFACEAQSANAARAMFRRKDRMAGLLWHLRYARDSERFPAAPRADQGQKEFQTALCVR
jgi:hypothetical protein